MPMLREAIRGLLFIHIFMLADSSLCKQHSMTWHAHCMNNYIFRRRGEAWMLDSSPWHVLSGNRGRYATASSCFFLLRASWFILLELHWHIQFTIHIVSSYAAEGEPLVASRHFAVKVL